MSDRAKEPDEVGPETGAKGFGYFGFIKVTRRGSERCLEPDGEITEATEPLFDAERHELHSRTERGSDSQCSHAPESSTYQRPARDSRI